MGQTRTALTDQAGQGLLPSGLFLPPLRERHKQDAFSQCFLRGALCTFELFKECAAAFSKGHTSGFVLVRRGLSVSSKHLLQRAFIQLISFSGGLHGKRWSKMGGRSSSASVEG
jgi:hypothetical protein